MKPLKESKYGYNDSEWKDLLTDFTVTDTTLSSNNINTSITYDEIGNVTSYNGITYTWTAGRQLASATDGTVIYRYSYNENGYLTKIRFEEDEESAEIIYIWDGDKLVARGLKGISEEDKDSILLSRILYDADGEAYGFSLESSTDVAQAFGGVYLYRKNLQGDVTAVINAKTGEVVIEFTYDAYGNVGASVPGEKLGDAIGAVFTLLFTPNLYRGYAYALTPNGICYYLGSRFYMPELGRFMNADKHTDTGTGVIGINMFAYCNNNPVMFVDPTGESATVSGVLGSALLVAAYAILVTGIVMTVLSASGITISFSEVLAAAIDALAQQTKLKVATVKLTAQALIASITISVTENKLEDIAKKYKNFQCKEAAKEMAKYLLKKKIDADVVHLRFIYTDGVHENIYSDKKGDVISTNAHHYGILYNNKIFCNVHPYGLNETNRINDFHCATGIKTCSFISLGDFLNGK